ncbi:ABC-2 family transporter [Paenibacillus cellulosilyticus]|uniref:ABC-2 family transporter n=1 Tax=Paenibacillus cellulosilyticus TaxID=375489 RepID=A0A2V2YLQ8_9BACL|nr:ABC transporter permease [Paenibacillus cellulosilyticus]PWV95170.1 ABC-2 family transporter [Paenibacillus cellulosilyticus]
MLKLMKLEMRKIRIGNYIRASMLVNVVILGIICIISLTEGMEEEGLLFADYDNVFSVIDTLIRGTYIVFAAVLISQLVIDEFRNKSITVLFMYPISRKKLIAAKLLIIVLFTLAADIVGNLFVDVGFYVLNVFASVVSEPFTWFDAAHSLLTIVMSALATSFLSLIPLYFGMRNHSGAATIVSSLIAVVFVCQNVDGFSMYSIIAVPISLALLGAAVAYISIRNIEQVDVLK